jgi:hypothetical protein
MGSSHYGPDAPRPLFRWDKGDTVRAVDCNFFSMEKEMKIINWDRIFVHHRTVPAVKRVEFVSDTISHICLRDRWSDIKHSECACTK